MNPTSRASAPDVSVLLVAEGEAFAEPLATQLEALGVQVDLIASGENITDAFIVPPQLVVLSAATAPDGGASVLAQLAQRAATSVVAVAVIGDATGGASRIDPLASPEQMAAQIATLASERRGSRARIPLPTPGVERSVVERPRMPPNPRAPLVSPARPPVPSSSAAPPSPLTSAPKPPLPKPMARPSKPFAKTLQLTAVRPSTGVPPSAVASAFASTAPPLASPPLASPPLASPPLASPPLASPPLPALPSIEASAVAAPSVITPPPPPTAPRARIRHGTLVGLPSPVAVIARDATQLAATQLAATQLAATQLAATQLAATQLAATLVGHPSPAASDASIDELSAPATVRPPAPETLAPETAPDAEPLPIAGEATDLGIEVPELRGLHASEPPIAGEPTDAGILLPHLASPSDETSDFAIAFEHKAAPEVPTGEIEVGTTELAAEATPILRMAPYAASAPSHDHPAAVPIPQRRSRWPLFASAALVLLVGAGAAGWYWMQQPIEPTVTSVPIITSPVGDPIAPVAVGAVPSVEGPAATAPTTDSALMVDPVVADPMVEPAVDPAVVEGAVIEGAVEAAAPPPTPSAPGVHLPLGADEPIEGTDAEFDLVRLGVEPIIDPGGRRTTRRRIDRLLAEAFRARSRARLDDSEEAYREVLALDPENARAIVGLSLVSADRDDHANAVLYARRLVRLHPTYPANLVLLGERYAAGGDVPSARRCFERALSIDRRHRGARAAISALH